jgi:hypothetical protein
VAGTGVYSFSNLVRPTYNEHVDISFSEGDVKGIKITNFSNNTLQLSLPFDKFSGNIPIYPSGSFLISTALGWAVPSGSSFSIANSGSDPVQVSCTFLGVGSMIVTACGFTNGFSIGFC